MSRWRNDSFLLMATPVVAALFQFLVLAYATLNQTAKEPANWLFGLLFAVALLLPAISIPAFMMSLRQFRAKKQRGVSIVACVLNGAYAALLFVGVLAIVVPFLSHANR